MIKKLDQELKREKSQIQLLKQSINDNSLLDGLDDIIDDNEFYKELGTHPNLLGLNLDIQSRNGSYNMPAVTSSSQSPPTRRGKKFNNADDKSTSSKRSKNASLLQ